ncbi:MAG TPA: enoyl-ACP reductase FabV [Pseudobacteroides sp.]|uniref:enoyl-ACP reductase FabV n=1 Tax=Pseudobacteroides sp. TaxID=1968840 RepID=UPI002F943B53
MIIKPKTRGFICTTAHPEGCAQNVQEQINYIKGKVPLEGPKKVLVIGASTGYGLASRIAAAFGSGAATIGVFFEKPASETKTASAGWYNAAAFDRKAKEAGLYSQNINGDAFSDEIKDKTIQLIKKDLGKIDMVVYSLASPRRIHPKTGVTHNSVIKPISNPFTNKTIDFHSGVVSEVTIQPASEDEIKDTVAVMGGEDWEMWIQALKSAGVLESGFKTVAFSYIGPELTHAIYTNGTIGKAKEHLDNSSKAITAQLKDIDGKAYISVNKALVTQASSAIPIVPLYISILYKIMKEKGLHEGCIEQAYRLFAEGLYSDSPTLDDSGKIRIDDWEMRSDVQEGIKPAWEQITTENVNSLSDLEGYRSDFFKLFGFGLKGVDYESDVNPVVEIPGVE